MPDHERIGRPVLCARGSGPVLLGTPGLCHLPRRANVGQVVAVSRRRPGSVQDGSAHPRNGAAILGFVAALLIIGSLVLWLFHLTSSTAQSTLGHFFSAGAFYAAESGLEMGLRELNQSPPNDIDSDGLVGTISNNGNPNDDPAIATGTFCVERVGTSPPTYRATGRPTQTTAPWSTYRRVVEIRVQ